MDALWRVKRYLRTTLSGESVNGVGAVLRFTFVKTHQIVHLKLVYFIVIKYTSVKTLEDKTTLGKLSGLM